MFVGCVAWIIFLMLVPDDMGEALLGENWYVAKPLILLYGLFVTADNIDIGPRTGMAALEAAKEGTISRAWISLLKLALPAAGAVIEGGIRGILIGATAASAASALIVFTFYVRARRKRYGPI